MTILIALPGFDVSNPSSILEACAGTVAMSPDCRGELARGMHPQLDHGRLRERSVHLAAPGDYVLVPRNVWHTARAAAAITLLFLTPGAGTGQKPVAG